MLQNNPELREKLGQLWNKFCFGGISNPRISMEQIITTGYSRSPMIKAMLHHSSSSCCERYMLPSVKL